MRKLCQICKQAYWACVCPSKFPDGQYYEIGEEWTDPKTNHKYEWDGYKWVKLINGS